MLMLNRLLQYVHRILHPISDADAIAMVRARLQEDITETQRETALLNAIDRQLEFNFLLDVFNQTTLRREYMKQIIPLIIKRHNGCDESAMHDAFIEGMHFEGMMHNKLFDVTTNNNSNTTNTNNGDYDENE